ncbi:N-acetylglucosamine kinase [Lachnoanaerobaculum saburreum]|uniref:BadF/BadG/BcrA/BcrD ATPase family protein n=1 Tax=Lachnoanaerobaculum saburreum TaxID=467210 RepID=A0A133ZLT7_9FIRM|nr:BadF/BadG/BcrA/BcrD ATPase family protein [Lachnoanaerobaculum saburreum]KXB56398.1 BadF/BadG/BcrA/BcrD ATPase family protein [Lachnoanaerobaculum saburreum]
MTKTYYIGIDGGGTKTKFDLFDSDKNSIASITMPTIHPAQASFKEVVSVLTDAKEKLLANINDSDYVLKVGAGLGGYGINADYRKKLEDEFSTVFDEFKLYSDAYAAMLGALAGEDGILMIAGTGSIALAKVGDETFRCGGFGYRYGDEGSAYSIGKALISRALKEADGRLDKSIISDLVADYFDNIGINIIATSDFSRDKIAGLAAAASKYVENSESVRDIFLAAAKEISLHIKAIGKNFESGKRVRLSYIGGVFRSEYILECIKEMNQGIELVAPIYPPEKGSILQV